MTKNNFSIYGDLLFRYNGDDETVAIPQGISKISGFAFENCEKLLSVTIPDGVTKIGEFAFKGCKNLITVNLPNSLIHIGESAFEYCDNLKNINVPSQVTKIEQCAFSHCKNLANEKGFTIIKNVLYNYYGKESNVNIPNGTIEIGRFAFGGHGGRMDNLTSVNIPDGVIAIDTYAFDCCRNLTSVNIPNSVVCFGEDVFGNCEKLTIYAPKGSCAEQYALNNDIPFIAK